MRRIRFAAKRRALNRRPLFCFLGIFLRDLWSGVLSAPPQGALGLFLQELGDVLVEEGFVSGACAGAGGVAPERRDGEKGAVGDVLRLVLRVGYREIEVGGGGHIE